MKILAIDCATASCSVAAWSDGEVLAVERAELARGQAEALLPMVERVRAAAGMAFADFDRLAVTVGPGHFTGLRSGLATARGLALATDRPLVGITTLAAIAAGVPMSEREGSIVMVALDSKRAEPYVQAFAPDLTPLADPQARLPDVVAAELASLSAPLVLAGDAAGVLAAALQARGAAVMLSTAAPRPDAVTVAALAAAAPPPTAAPAPLYIHPPETTAPRPRALTP